LFEKDREIHGKSINAPGFVLISDGQAWSGKVEAAIKDTASRGIPIHVIGVGTSAGGLIPNPAANAEIEPPIHSSLDRASLLAIATAGNGSYTELDRESDHDIATRIIDSVRKQANNRAVEQTRQEIYWPFLLSIACVIGLGLLAVQDLRELWLHAGAASVALAALWLLTN